MMKSPELPMRDVCCGCAACFNACPDSAIAMRPDAEGFLRPEIDASKCRCCGVCERVCPVLNRSEPRRPLQVAAVRALDDGLRMMSSSGGIFSLLARQVLARGGSVFGAVVRDSDLMVCHAEATDEAGLARMRGSKYVQSDVGAVCVTVRERLDAGHPVLFSGTPCQVAACRRYLGREYDNLLLVDFVCHGVPSPLAWQRSLDARLAPRGWGRRTRHLPSRGVSFRDKGYGWRNFSLVLRFADGSVYSRTVVDDPYLKGFLANLFLRPSCHHCQFRDMRSGADVTLGDGWHIDRVMSGMDDNSGTSIVLVNSEKGCRAFDAIGVGLSQKACRYEDVLSINAAVTEDPVPHPNRERFFRLLNRPFVHFDLLVAYLTERGFSPYARAVVKRTVKGFLLPGRDLAVHA